MATILGRVAPKDKPYRIYRGGRVKGPIRPETSKSGRKAEKANGPEPQEYRGPRPARTRRRGQRDDRVVSLQR